MKISVTITRKTPVHITCRLFVNGGLSGELILRNEEWVQFMEILQPDVIREEYVPLPVDDTQSQL